MAIINIADHGAVGDALYYNEADNSYYADPDFTIQPTDDTQAIRDALAIAKPYDRVIIPAGYTYNIKGTLIAPEGVEFEGEDEHNSKLVLGNGFSLSSFMLRPTDTRVGNVQAIIATPDDSSDILMKNFTLEGNKNTIVWGDWGLSGVFLRKINNVKLEGVHVNWINVLADLSKVFEGWNILSTDATGVTYDKCSAEYAGYQPFGFFDRSYNGVMKDCTSGMGWRTSVQVHRECDNIQILNNTIIQQDNPYDNEPHAAVTFHGEEGEEVRNVTFDGNYVECGVGYKAAIQAFRQSEGLKVTNNEIKSNSAGIYLGDADGATVEHNNVSSLEYSVPTAHGNVGVYVTDNTKNSTVKHNTILGFDTKIYRDPSVITNVDISDNRDSLGKLHYGRLVKNENGKISEVEPFVDVDGKKRKGKAVVIY